MDICRTIHARIVEARRNGAHDPRLSISGIRNSHALIAQRLEQSAYIRPVLGSSPSGRIEVTMVTAKYYWLVALLRRKGYLEKKVSNARDHGRPPR